ncbi:hypothetical protein [Agromyces bauzanensis]|uniref:Transposase DDE domain-containing protein n=1 Tax=Agromyces bauzanensis TaxID=1308924 RepID=A0A917PVR9_9MICO|nr:hypothetical protein [Agromyces bauzanensis]GGJ94923.1 hypothetical protein GCM10011372_36510 [Agromyces bauzanensis]
MKAYGRITPVFDESNLVSHVGLVPVLTLAGRAGLSGLVGEHVTLPAANMGVKARTVVAGMLAGADSIGDLDVLRAGGDLEGDRPVARAVHDRHVPAPVRAWGACCSWRR